MYRHIQIAYRIEGSAISLYPIIYDYYPYTDLDEDFDDVEDLPDTETGLDDLLAEALFSKKRWAVELKRFLRGKLGVSRLKGDMIGVYGFILVFERLTPGIVRKIDVLNDPLRRARGGAWCLRVQGRERQGFVRRGVHVVTWPTVIYRVIYNPLPWQR